MSPRQYTTFIVYNQSVVLLTDVLNLYVRTLRDGKRQIRGETCTSDVTGDGR